MEIVKITSTNFEAEVKSSEKPVLLDFFANWCGPCKMLAPILEEIASETDDFKIGKVNVDEEGELAREFGITSIPTLVVVEGGKEVRRSTGYRPKEDVLLLI
ncbi:MAG: thioredoxin [Clostridia bacterium]|nr:thioredoxin [Clostridia bacterium]